MTLVWQGIIVFAAAFFVSGFVTGWMWDWLARRIKKRRWRNRYLIKSGDVVCFDGEKIRAMRVSDYGARPVGVALSSMVEERDGQLVYRVALGGVAQAHAGELQAEGR